MKKNYPGLGILICLSFLFTLNSCTTDTPVSDEVEMKNEIHYNSRKADSVPVNMLNPDISAGQIRNDLFNVHYPPDSFPVSISNYSAQAEAEKVVDPDWKNLVTHFIEVNGDTE